VAKVVACKYFERQTLEYLVKQNISAHHPSLHALYYRYCHLNSNILYWLELCTAL